MKYLILLSLSLSAHADQLEVIQVDKPILCQSPQMPTPMPCAFIKAMIERMQAKCHGCSNQTCSVKS